MCVACAIIFHGVANISLDESGMCKCIHMNVVGRNPF